MTDRNPYDPNSPEWQLFVNWQSKQNLAIAYAKDAERFQRMAEEARQSAEAYREALEKLNKR